ncbi:DUF3857 domain-containing protein [Pelagicoccus sp. SDUM812003]|uniref:DUF3857 domain-containing protein n=1 Tax=Pelagicoccus sp. SDUM812003 TaxID=3041267 RepID=UPI00280F9C0B|nr:DUF3857 domain-containing protein [Pelagicoccus sp. SDUM812003]MDQ8204591.1 DUF3857 domain-containing protein [Pelagicoccus sp. SDUM812003]
MRFRFVFFSLLVSLLLSHPLRSEEKPAFLADIPFYETVKDRLLQVEDVRGGIERFKDSSEPGIVLLNERIEYIVSDTERYRVDHGIYYVLAESGVSASSKEIFRYRKDQEEPFLVLGRTYLPDGRIIDVDPDAVFTQSPQDEADSDLYTDQEELVVIYPNVAVGSITECIVITKETKPLVSSHTMHSFPFQFNWPIHRTHYELDVPEDFAARMSFSNSGSKVPDPQSTTYDGRTKWIWEDLNREGKDYEVKREPMSDVGPIARVTTFDRWDVVGNWIRDLANERNQLSQEMRTSIDAWTEGMSDEREIAQAILDRVANDVRYTGLEFGLAGFQPADCNAVWDRKYGDCKDKSNLLAAALRHKGIPAFLVLIDTDGFGKFDKRCPSPFYFNHAIALVEFSDGQSLFLDPTVENLRLGSLPLSDIDRDVLVVREDRATLERTPATPAGTLTFSFDLKLTGDHTASGWYRLYATEYYESSYLTFYQDKSPEGLRNSLHDQIDGFYPGAEMADVIFDGRPAEGQPMVSAYFVIKGDESSDPNQFTFGLPDVTWILPTVGDSPNDRFSDYRVDFDSSIIDLTIALPGNIKPNALPKEINLATPKYKYAGSWWLEQNSLRARITVENRTDRIEAAEFSAFHNAVTSLNRWWNKPISFSNVESLQSAESESDAPFPKLSSAKAQLALLDELYELEKEPKKRREALLRTIEWFPEDRPELYEAKMEIARIDTGETPPLELAKWIKDQLAEYGDEVTPSMKAWGEYLLAQELDTADKDNEALKLFKSHLGNDELTPYRRGWSAYNAAWIYRERGSKELVKMAKEGLSEESPAQNDLAYLLIAFHVTQEDARRLASDLKWLENAHAEAFEQMIEYAAEELEDNVDISSEKSLEIWKNALQDLASNRPRLSDSLVSVERIESSLKLSRQLKDAAATIASSFQELDAKWYTENQAPKRVSKQELEEMILATEQEQEWDRQAALSFDFFTRFPDDQELATKYLYWAIWSITHHVAAPELTDPLKEVLSTLVPSNDNIVNADLNFAQILRSRGRANEAVELIAGWLEYPAHPAGNRGILRARLGDALLDAGRTAEAIDAYLEGGKDHFENRNIYEGLLRAYFLSRLEGLNTKAEQALDFLADADSDQLAAANVADQTGRILRMRQNEGLYRDYATQSHTPMEAVKNLIEKLGYNLRISGLSSLSPLISDYEELEKSCREAIRDEDLDTLHQGLLRYAISACANEQDLVGLMQLISLNGLSDPASVELFAALAPLGEFAVENGSYLNRELLKRLVVHAYYLSRDIDNMDRWVSEVRSAPETSEETMSYALLIWTSLIAVNGVLEHESFSSLEAYLDQADMGRFRAQAVNLVAAQKVDKKDYKALKQLVERELQHPLISQNEPICDALRGYLATANREFDVKGEFTQKVKAFRSENHLLWWDHVRPFEMSELYADGTALLNDIPGKLESLSALEMAKYYFLLAENEEEPLSVRRKALVNGVYNWQRFAPDPDWFFDRIESITSDEQIDLHTRNLIKLNFVEHLVDTRNVQLLDRLMQDASFLTEYYKTEYKHLLEYLKLPQESLEDWKASVAFLLEGPIIGMDVVQIKKAIGYGTVRFGEDAAKPILENLKSIEISDRQNMDKSQVRLDALQTLRMASSLAPFYESVTANLPVGDSAASSFAPFQLLSLSEYPEQLALQVSRFGYSEQLITHLADMIFYQNSVVHQDITSLLAESVEQLENLANPLLGSAIALCLLEGIDVDNPEQREPLLSAMRQFAVENQDAMMTDVYNSLSLYFPSGTSEGVQPFLRMLGYDPAYERVARLLDLVEKGKKSKALAMLQGFDSETLLADHFIALFYQIAQAYGDDLTTELLSDRIVEQIEKKAAWSISSWELAPISMTSLLVGFPEHREKMEWFFDYVLEVSRNELVRAHAATLKAYAEEDWQGVIENAAEAEEVSPGFWDLEVLRGVAFYELEKPLASKEAFETYLKYRSRDSLLLFVRDYLNRIDGSNVFE